MRALDEIGFTYGDPGGAFYIYTNVSKSGLSASNFCKKALENTGVLLFPGTLFGDEEDKYIRLSYLQPIEKIQESMKKELKDLSMNTNKENKFVGVQTSPISFIDEGVDTVLDTLQNRVGVNVLLEQFLG